ncbi:MAG: putative transcriptional regulator [Halobacteriales archaeon]|jgi:putative transcriptional regulator
MVDVLENKRVATRYRILVEIADNQPAVSQGEIADAVGVTSQAVSEYIRELVEDDLVEKEGRSRYRVTKEGVDWLFRASADLERFVDHVSEDVLGSVQEDAAIATASIDEGETVTLKVESGLLRATPGDVGPATGVATMDARPEEDVGVTGFEGVIDLEPGLVTVRQVPPVRSGGSREGNLDALVETCEAADLVTADGVEAIVTLRKIGAEPDETFAPGAVAADAANRGLNVVVVTTTDDVGRVTDELRDAGVAYEVENSD